METYSKGFEITFKKFNEKTTMNDYSFSLKALNRDLGFNMLKVVEGKEKKSDLISRLKKESEEEENKGDEGNYISKLEIVKMNPGAKTQV